VHEAKTSVNATDGQQPTPGTPWSRPFGRERIEAHIKQVIDVIRSWGFSRFMAKDVQWALCTVLLANKSPNLHDLNTDILRAERDVATVHYRATSITILSSALWRSP
jgi:hypothetical protein